MSYLHVIAATLAALLAQTALTEFIVFIGLPRSGWFDLIFFVSFLVLFLAWIDERRRFW